MTIGVYTGSFDPFHEGHNEVLNKACAVFDTVFVAIGINPGKNSRLIHERVKELERIFEANKKYNVEVHSYEGLFADYLKNLKKVDAVIKGLRNISDFENEKTQQYWNEDLGITIPTFYVIGSRNTCHISSSAIKMVNAMKKD